MSVEEIMETIKKELYGEQKSELVSVASQMKDNAETYKFEELVSANLNLYCMSRVNEYKSREQLIIFGAGTYGIKLCNFLFSCGCKEKIVAFCDNNVDKYGKEIEGVPILSAEDAKKKFPNATFIITPKGAENEIIRQLVHLGINIDNISVFIFLLAAI